MYSQTFIRTVNQTRPYMLLDKVGCVPLTWSSFRYMWISIPGNGSRWYREPVAHREIRAIRVLLDQKAHKAHKVARLAMRHWRQAQATAMRWAEAEHERQGLGDDALIWLNIYAALPKFVELYCGGPAYDPAAMRQEVLDALAGYDFLVREPEA